MRYSTRLILSALATGIVLTSGVSIFELLENLLSVFGIEGFMNAWIAASGSTFFILVWIYALAMWVLGTKDSEK